MPRVEGKENKYTAHNSAPKLAVNKKEGGVTHKYIRLNIYICI